jgi:hypothetical protein
MSTNNKYKYQVGQKLKVRMDLKKGEKYKMEHNSEITQSATREMVELCGLTVEIEKILFGYYKVKGSTLNWTDEMFGSIVVKGNGVAEVEERHEDFGHSVYVSKVIYSEPATIVFYRTTKDENEPLKKSVSKCSSKDKYDKEKGYEIAVLKAFKRQIDKKLKKF